MRTRYGTQTPNIIVLQALESDCSDSNSTFPGSLFLPYADDYSRASTSLLKKSRPNQHGSRKGIRTCKRQVRWLVKNQQLIFRRLSEIKQLLEALQTEERRPTTTTTTTTTTGVAISFGLMFNRMMTLEDFDRFAAALDVFNVWNADHSADRQQLEEALKKALKKAHDRLRKRQHRPTGGRSFNDDTSKSYGRGPSTPPYCKFV
nr:unnamed protein product [Spirometra erinaceieuropaei]